jgi:uncharacterized delta-60 repeat protein
MRIIVLPSKKLTQAVKAFFLAITLLIAGTSVVHAAESDGTFDTSWSGSGISYGTNIADGYQSIDIKGLANNKYVVLSSLKTTGANSPTGFVLNQYTAAGLPDTSFSTDGKVEYAKPSAMAYMEPALIQILSDGSILVIGHFGFSGGAFIVKFDSTGNIDSSFGTSGITTASTTSNDSAMYYSSYVAPSGNIYVMSKMNLVTITRFTSAGALDTTGFGSVGSQGFFAGSIGSSTYYWRGFSVDETSSPAKILLWGADNATGNVIATRWNMAATNGRIQPSTVDSGYGTGGIYSVSTGLGSGVVQTRDITTASSGNVYIRIGQKLIGFNPSSATVVNGFGTSGVADISSNGISANSFVGVTSATVSSSDVIFVTGFTGSDNVVAKYDSTGTLAASFGTGGIRALTPCGVMSITKTIRRSDGSILVSGHKYDYAASTYSLRQYLLGAGGSASQCGTTTTTSTNPPSQGGGGSGGGGGGGMLATPIATAVEDLGQGIRITVTNLSAGARIAAMISPVGTVMGAEMAWVSEGGTNASTFLATETVWISSVGNMSNPTIIRRGSLVAGTSYSVRIYQIIGSFGNPTSSSSSAIRVVAMTSNVSAVTTTTVAATTTTLAATATTVPKTTQVAAVGNFATAVPGVTVTDAKVYTVAPTKVSADSAINALTPAESKKFDIVSKTPSVCLPNDEDLVFLDDGRCIATIVNEKTRAVLRTLKTTVVETDISELKVGNEIAILSPLYFSAGSAVMKESSAKRLTGLAATVKAAGSILIAGHSGTLMGNTPENQLLSRKRAATVVAAVKKLGATAPIAIAAVGALDPASKGTTQAAQDKNRRAIVVLIP